jgi:hypothetical protein
MLLSKLSHHFTIIKNLIKTFGLFHGSRNIYYHYFYKRFTDAVISDYVYEKSSYRYIARFYKENNFLFEIKRPVNEIKQNQSIYWTCWLQGIENAPDMVKACFRSAQKNASGHQIIIITYENLSKYVILPKYILEKHKAGYITSTHFSDILRVYLLYIYGGVWFDATVFFTQEIPSNLLKIPLFFFKDILKSKYCPISSWFITANRPHNLLLYNTLCMLYKYWDINNTMIDYFMLHYCVNIIIENNQECKNIFDKIPYISNQTPHYLQLKLFFSKFDEKIWENVRNISFCHKLTYKIDHSKSNIADSYFNHILDDYLQEIIK